MVEKKTRVPLLLSKEEIEGIDEWKTRRGHRTTAEAVRELIDNGKALPLLVVDLLDAIEAEGFLYYEDMAAPVQAIIDKLELYVDLTFPQLEKGVAGGKPYWAAREAIRVARLEIEEAKKQPPKPAKIRFKKVVKEKGGR